MVELHTPICHELVCFVQKQRSARENGLEMLLLQSSVKVVGYANASNTILTSHTFKFSHPSTSVTT